MIWGVLCRAQGCNVHAWFPNHCPTGWWIRKSPTITSTLSRIARWLMQWILFIPLLQIPFPLIKSRDTDINFCFFFLLSESRGIKFFTTEDLMKNCLGFCWEEKWVQMWTDCDYRARTGCRRQAAMLWAQLGSNWLSYPCPYHSKMHALVLPGTAVVVEAFELERTHKGHLVQLRCHEQEHLQLDQVVQSPVQPDLVCLQGAPTTSLTTCSCQTSPPLKQHPESTQWY